MLTILEKNKNKFFEENDNDYVIQSSHRRVDLIHAIDLVLNFNKTIQLDLVWKHRAKNKQDEYLLCEVQKKKKKKKKKNPENIDLKNV